MPLYLARTPARVTRGNPLGAECAPQPQLLELPRRETPAPALSDLADRSAGAGPVTSLDTGRAPRALRLPVHRSPGKRGGGDVQVFPGAIGQDPMQGRSPSPVPAVLPRYWHSSGPLRLAAAQA